MRFFGVGERTWRRGQLEDIFSSPLVGQEAGSYTPPRLLSSFSALAPVPHTSPISSYPPAVLRPVMLQRAGWNSEGRWFGQPTRQTTEGERVERLQATNPRPPHPPPLSKSCGAHLQIETDPPSTCETPLWDGRGWVCCAPEGRPGANSQVARIPRQISGRGYLRSVSDWTCMKVGHHLGGFGCGVGGLGTGSPRQVCSTEPVPWSGMYYSVVNTLDDSITVCGFAPRYPGTPNTNMNAPL